MRVPIRYYVLNGEDITIGNDLKQYFQFHRRGDHICGLLTSNRTFWEKKKRAIYLGATAKK